MAFDRECVTENWLTPISTVYITQHVCETHNFIVILCATCIIAKYYLSDDHAKHSVPAPVGQLFTISPVA